MTVTSNDIANQALQMIGNNQAAVEGQYPTFDDSTAGIALQYLYGPCVQTVQRQWEWDASRNTVSLTMSGNFPPSPWLYEYIYPTNGIEVWQLTPASYDPLDPLPVNFVIANNVVNGSQIRVIQTNLKNAKAVYNNNPTENAWDAGFREAVVRLLASELAIALAGKPETSKLGLDSSAAFMQAAKNRQG